MQLDNPHEKRKPKLCFVCVYCYPLFNPKNKSIFGGSEVRVAQIAKEIARRGNFHVSLIVADHGQQHKESIDNVELIQWKDWLYWNVPELAQLETIANSLSTYQIPHEMIDTPNQIKDTTSDLTDMEFEITNELPKKRSPQSKIKLIYKRVIPWRLRIILDGVITGVEDGFQQLRKNSFTKKNIIASFGYLTNYVSRRLFTAKNAFSHIGDEAVFPSSVRAFEEADADLYIVPGNNWISAWTACYCNKRGKAYVMLSGSDIDFSTDIIINPTEVDMYMNPNRLKAYALNNAKLHIVQNERQVMLAREFGIEPILIRNPINIKWNYPKKTEDQMVLWVGNTDERVKRPTLMLDVIEQLPNYKFLMIITDVTPEGFVNWIQKTAHISNLTSLTGVPFSEIEQYYAQAKVLVNTSAFEGFPNTFLQAGKYGVPIVSLTVDPNEIISKHGCGLLCDDDVECLVNKIRLLVENHELYDQLSRSILTYVSKFHDIGNIILEHEKILTTLL